MGVGAENEDDNPVLRFFTTVYKTAMGELDPEGEEGTIRGRKDPEGIIGTSGASSLNLQGFLLGRETLKSFWGFVGKGKGSWMDGQWSALSSFFENF